MSDERQVIKRTVILNKTDPPALIRIFIPVGNCLSQSIWVIDKGQDGSVKRQKSFGVLYVPLTDAPTD